MGSLLTDLVLGLIGSIPFIVFQTVFFGAWMIGNKWGWFHFDLPPYLGMNIIMSIEAAYATSFVLLADKRQAARAKKHEKYMQTLLESTKIILQDHKELLSMLAKEGQEMADDIQDIKDQMHERD